MLLDYCVIGLIDGLFGSWVIGLFGYWVIRLLGYWFIRLLGGLSGSLGCLWGGSEGSPGDPGLGASSSAETIVIYRV